jgi:hypothetical protein
MTINRKLTIGIIALLAVNLLILAFFFTKHRDDFKRGDEARKNPREMVVKKLDFDSGQEASFNALVDIHKKQIMHNDSLIWSVKTQIFDALSDDKIKNVDSLASQIGELQEGIEVSHYNHFMKVKALCREDQIQKFNELSKELSKMFSERRRGRKDKK